MIYTQNGFARHVYVVVILVVCVILAAATLLLPKGFSEDLSKIGQGSVVLVLTHDKNYMGGAVAMKMLNTLRSDYEGRVDFLAIDVNTPKGQAFTRLQGVRAEVLVLFGPDGSRRDVFRAGIGEKELRSVLDSILSR
jgi:hypothetical protein